jgi:hypothetical protein
MSDQKKIHKVYDKKVKQITKSKKLNLGNGSTTNFQLDEASEYLLPPGKYQGTFPYDKLPSLKSTHSCIINLDNSTQPGSHWVAIYRSGLRLCCYDSFGRKAKQILPDMKIRKGLKVSNSDLDAEQTHDEKNCGPRCLAWLDIVYSKGIEEALKI